MYRHLVQGVEDYAIYMLSPDGTVANWNAGAERTKGYAADEIVGQNFSCFYTPEDRASGLPQAGLARARDRFAAEGWRVRGRHPVLGQRGDRRDPRRRRRTARLRQDHARRDRAPHAGTAAAARQGNDRALQRRAGLAVELPGRGDFADPFLRAGDGRGVAPDRAGQPPVQAMFGVDRADMRGRTMQECLPEQACAFFERLCNDALRSDGAMREEEEELSTTLGPRSLRTKTLVFHNSDPRSRYVLLIADDVTDENAAHAQVRYMAHHDTLTGMPAAVPRTDAEGAERGQRRPRHRRAVPGPGQFQERQRHAGPPVRRRAAAPRPSACPRSCANRTRWRGWAATNSPWCCPTSSRPRTCAAWRSWTPCARRSRSTVTPYR